MAHVEVTVEVDHQTADGLEEPHVLQVKVDGLDAESAWDRATEAVYGFLRAEAESREWGGQVAKEVESRCNHLLNTPRDGGFSCDLPPDHRQAHQNFQSGRSWPQRTPPEGTEQKRLYHQAMINRIWCNVAMPTSPLGHCCNLWRHHAGPHEYDRQRDNQHQEECA